MLTVQVDQAAIEQLYRDEIAKKVASVENELIFWDTKELKRRTCLSWNTIQDAFFHDKDFPKVKLGGKWLFPAKETEEFLSKWLNGKRHKRSI